MNILLDGFLEQSIPFVCPECNTMLEACNFIGRGEYPLGGFRSSIKSGNGAGFECPDCFTKSVCHCDADTLYIIGLRDGT